MKDEPKLTLIDFNVSRRFREKFKTNMDDSLSKHPSMSSESPGMKRILMLTHTGAAAYTAPEIQLGYSYTEKIDMWGVGCVLYNSIFGSVPFP